MRLFLIAALTASLASQGWTADAAIGMALARGSFRLDHSTVFGNATLFEGATVETSGVPSQLRLRSGVRAILDSASRGRVYQDRLLLESGVGQTENAPGYRIEARGLWIQAVAAGSIAQVKLSGARQVLVGAWDGPVEIFNNRGALVARLDPGRVLELETQAPGQEVAYTLTGCLEKRGQSFFLADRTSGAVYWEVQGLNLDREVSYAVQVSGESVPGAKPASGATEVIKVRRLTRLGACKGDPAAMPVPAARSGMGAGTKALIAGVVVGGAAGGALAAIKLKEEEKPPLSR